MNHTEILKLGNPILRKTATSFTEDSFGTAELADLADLLINIMITEKGIGLAAPQIGIEKRAIAFGFDNSVDKNLPNIPFQVLFNPSFEPIGETMVEAYEGCLSVGELRAKVPRYQTIYFKGYDVEGNLIENEVTDLYARVFQHEYDHLNGVIFLDRVKDYQSLAFHDELVKVNTLQNTTCKDV